MKRHLWWLVAAGLVIAVGAAARWHSAAAQGGLDPVAPPSFGMSILPDAFAPDPLVVTLTSGGIVDVGGTMAGTCAGDPQGYAASAPDYRVKYAGEAAGLLRFLVAAEGDTTLVIQSPNRGWFCDDDGAGNQNPMITFQQPLAGWYNVWVGSYLLGQAVVGELFVTRQDIPPDQLAQQGGGIEPQTPQLPVVGLEPGAVPGYGIVDLSAGFLPDPFTQQVSSGGSTDVRTALAAVCEGQAAGWVATAPDFRVAYAAGGASRLRFFFAGDGDATLVVSGPDGRWTCSDDYGGGQDPLIEFSPPAGGVYNVWVGSYNQGETVNGALYVTELDQTPFDYAGGAAAVADTPAAPAVISGFEVAAPEANYGTVTLQAGFLPDPYQVRLTSGGAVGVAASLGTVCEGDAQGYAASTPDYRVIYTAGSGIPLRFVFSGDGDATLMVHGPDNRWTCSDDFAGGQDPVITLSAPVSGQYDVWVGSYYQGDFVNGVLVVTEQNLTPADIIR